MNPMARIVEAVIKESAPGGRSYDYLQRQADWEGQMRTAFAEMVASNDLELAEERLRYLNGKYMTRYPLEHIPLTAGCIWNELRSRRWDVEKPPYLFGCSEEQKGKLSGLVPVILAAIAKADAPRPYSLTTKYLHFCFPESFPICDNQAAESIQMWGYMAFDHRGEEWQQFSWSRLVDTSGSGYRGVLEFYRRFWQAASDEQRSQLTEHARHLSDVVGGNVSTLDLIDKLLWMASGDPLPLGLA